MGNADEEQVLVAPARVFHELGHFQGFSSQVDRYLPRLLAPENLSFRPRSEMEQDPRFKQLIPYVLFRCGDTFFHYRRGKGQGEKRLRSLWSLGVGGHVSSTDRAVGETLGALTYDQGLRRELDEEVRVEVPYELKTIGLINDDQTDVGRVHLGIVHLAELSAPAVHPRESHVEDAGFAEVEAILGRLAEYETWSQICIQVLVRHEGWKLEQAQQQQQ